LKKLPRRFGHFVYGGIQAGITTGVATGIASVEYLHTGTFLTRWPKVWVTSWLLMIPVVLLAAPLIRRLTLLVARDDP